jgi:hypothetical protein
MDTVRAEPGQKESFVRKREGEGEEGLDVE